MLRGERACKNQLANGLHLWILMITIHIHGQMAVERIIALGCEDRLESKENSEKTRASVDDLT